MLKVSSDDYGEWYKLVDNPNDLNDPEWCVELIEGEWTGMLYKYTQYNFDAKSNKVKFGYDVLYVPGVKYPDEYQEKFDKLLGDILIDIVSKSINKNLKESEDAKFGNTYSEGSDVRRIVYKESNPFLKV